MLNFLRDKFKYLSWLLWVIVAIFIAFIFVDFGGGLSKGGDASNRPTEAAAVGKMSVSMAEFQDEYRQLEEQFREMYGEQFTSEVARQMRLPLQALDRAIRTQIDRVVRLATERVERGRRAARIGGQRKGSSLESLRAATQQHGACRVIRRRG